MQGIVKEYIKEIKDLMKNSDKYSSYHEDLTKDYTRLSITLNKINGNKYIQIGIYKIEGTGEKGLSYLITDNKDRMETCINCFLLEAEDHWEKEIKKDFITLLEQKGT